MKKFHIDEPREIGKRRDRVSRKELNMVKDDLTEIVVRKKIREMVKQELKEEAAMKSDIKKMEKMANNIVRNMEQLNDLFRRVHKPKTNDSVLYNTMKDWDHLARKVSREYGGWFGFVKDSDYVK